MFSLGTDEVPLYDYKSFSHVKIKNKNMYADEETGQFQNVSWMKAKVIKYGVWSNSEIGFLESFHHDEVCHIVDTSKSPKGRKTRRDELSAPTLHMIADDNTELLKVSEKKIDGLLGLVRKKQIPSMYHGFYKSLKADKNNEKNSDDDSVSGSD